MFVNALVVVDSVAGIEVQTEKLWKAAESFDLPVLFGVNLMDRERASFTRTVEALQKKWGREVTPVQVPIGEEANFKGVVDLISGKAFTWEPDESGTATEVDVPGDLADEVSSAREALMDLAVDRKTLLARFHAQEASQPVVSGAAAFAAMWRAIPALRPFGLIARFPPVLWVLEGAYRVFLRFRRRLQRLARRAD